MPGAEWWVWRLEGHKRVTNLAIDQCYIGCLEGLPACTVAAMPGGAILVQWSVPAGQKQANVMPLMDSTANTHHSEFHICIVE